MKKLVSCKKSKNILKNTEKIETALDYIKEYHAHQYRKINKKPFFTHPVAVADILMQYAPNIVDEDMLLAALLHDTVEDTNMTLAFIAVCFGEDVMLLVNSLTNTDIGLRGQSISKSAVLGKIYRGGDRAMTLKLCDRLHNMQTLKGLPEEKKQAKAKETKSNYLPEASALGLTDLYRELNQLVVDNT